MASSCLAHVLKLMKLLSSSSSLFFFFFFFNSMDT
jgi:hypothetical protein